jgi:hypothetical protein
MVPNVQAMETLEARLSQAMPLGRLISADEVARAVLF